ncbi:MAG: hypothetical protein V2I33_25505, partial [Kangiellaceae bacterium]|nr:hypothetical protein [Kangiellaceae bacterium]
TCPLGYEANDEKTCVLKEQSKVFMNVQFIQKIIEQKEGSPNWTVVESSAPKFSCHRGFYFAGAEKIVSDAYLLHSNH